MLKLIMRRFFYPCGFLVFLGPLCAATGHADIISVLESPAADQKVSGISAVSGWAFSSDPAAHLTIEFSVDGGASAPIPCCTERLDVARAHANFSQALRSGFALLYNFNILSEGSHKVVVTIQDGVSPPLVQEHAIVVAKPGGFEFLDNLTLSSASSTSLSSDQQEIIIQGAQAEDKATGAQQKVNLHLAWQENAQRIGVVASENVGKPSGGSSSSGGTTSDCSTTDTCPSPPAIQLTLENPSGGATGIATETLSGIGVVSGWTFSSTSGATITRIQLRVDGQSAGEIPCCSERQDVKAGFANHPQALQSGFGALVNFNLFDGATHIISIDVQDSTGATAHVARTIETIKVADSEFLDQFDLSAATASVEGETLLLDGIKVRDKASQNVTPVTVGYAWQQDCQCFIAQAGCGNGAIESGEECDGSNLGGDSCASLGFSGGSLVCRPRCAANDNNCVLPCILNVQGCTGGPSIYVTNVTSNTVSVINLASDYVTTDEIVKTIDVGRQPRGIAISPNGPVAYVTNFKDDTVSVIDTTSNTVVGDPIEVGAGPLGVAFAPNGVTAYVVNGSGDSVSVIDTATRKVVTSIPVGVHPQAIALTADGKLAYVTNYGEDSMTHNGGNSVTVLDLGANEPLTTVLVGKGPDGIAVSPDDKAVYVVNFDGGTVSVLDRASNKVTANVVVELQPTKVTFSHDGLEAYVSNSVSETISVIDTSQLKLVNTFQVVSKNSVATHPDGLVVTPGDTRLYVALFGNGFGAEVEVISTLTNNVLETIKVGDGPFAVAITPTPGQP